MKRTDQRWTGLMLALLALGAISLWSAFAMIETGGERPCVAALNYALGKPNLRNSWLIAASEWPSMRPGDMAELKRDPAAGERERFERWVKGTLGKEWQPEDFDDIPCLAGYGLVYVKETDGYCLRAREAWEPLYEGSDTIKRALVVAVQLRPGNIAVPKTRVAMESLLKQFLHPEALPKGAGDVRCETEAGGYFMARHRTGSLVPTQLYAWTDGKVLLMALYEDVPFGSAPPPPTWNDWTVDGMAPTMRDVHSLAANEEESASARVTSLKRIKRVLTPQLMPAEFAQHLVALRGWQGKNVFVVRHRLGDRLMQVIEGEGRIIVEVRKADGSALAQKAEDLPQLARTVAQEILSEGAQPKDFHVGQERDDSKIGSWVTVDQVASDGIALERCDVYAQASFVRYEFPEIVPGTDGAGRPARYSFLEGKGGLRKELTPEELANEVN
jgi:hypothetical protein